MPEPARDLLYLGGRPLHRDTLRVALCRFGFRVLSAVSIPEAIDRLGDAHVTAALVDDDGLGEDLTLDAVRTVLRKQPDLKVGVLSDSRSPAFPAAVIRAGATAYLTKESPLGEFRYAVDRMLQGQLVVDPMVARALLGGAVAGPGLGRDDGARPHLTPVEARVLRLAAEGNLNKQIAHQLGLSPLTVKNHLARIRARLGATDKAHAVATALRAGLLD